MAGARFGLHGVGGLETRQPDHCLAAAPGTPAAGPYLQCLSGTSALPCLGP
eukprot:NODE_4836_length_760_cov_3.319269_g4038_i0.p5 GENE.NODE_4836_length_760_cov_3.319269_g4038_i0~~NODE_4836_length_760_cov_3.319269_g4038_i0.p5  ORF type:complete len:51 (+),score=1.35 NODE_4836_length_760_cov_3.319269_g4038_i0:524-676(+)